MKRVDCFQFNDELDMLECRLVELDPVVDYFVLVEADVTFQLTPKPLHYRENADRFAAWADRIVAVTAADLPTDPSPWVREFAQREFIGEGLARLDLAADDVVLHSDVDEIPTRDAARLVMPRGFVAFEQRFHCFAVDWLHPGPWRGTVAGRVRDIDKHLAMRDSRFFAPTVLPDAGWHFSWVGGDAYSEAKMDAFSHPEIGRAWRHRLPQCRAEGWHVDGAKLEPVDVVAGEWPQWITDGHAPVEWFRPR